MTLIDFWGKALDTIGDIATSKQMQGNVDKAYRKGTVSQEDYDKYQDALRDYKRKKGIDDDDY